MANSGKELVGWSEQRWTAAQEAVNRALARTAKCRQVIVKGDEGNTLIGAKTVPVPMVVRSGAGTGTYELKDEITAPVYLSVALQFDDQHADDEKAILSQFESAAAELGQIEDGRMLNAKGGTERNPKMVPWGLAVTANITTAVNLATADATGILNAITDAVSELEKANRPGPCGLILANGLLAKLRQPVRAGDGPPLPQAEQLIGTSEIAGSSALDGAKKGQTCGVIFRLEPPAVDFVYTLLPSVTVLERTGGKTKLSVEEEIALRVLDEKAVVKILAP